MAARTFVLVFLDFGTLSDMTGWAGYDISFFNVLTPEQEEEQHNEVIVYAVLGPRLNISINYIDQGRSEPTADPRRNALYPRFSS